jgi:biotin operon repressor
VQELWGHRVQNIGNRVTLNMKTDEHLYTISRTEFAKEIGKSREAVKKDMQRGKYKDLYIFKNGKYFFKSQEGMREKQDCPLINLSPVKPKVNRGGHEMAVRKGRYPNLAFANHNHMKKMIALRGKMTPEELALVPTVERMVKQERQKQLQESLELPTSKYRPIRTSRSNTFSSNGIYHCGSNKGYGSPGYVGGTYTDTRSYVSTNRGRNINKKGPYEI